MIYKKEEKAILHSLKYNQSEEKNTYQVIIILMMS